METFKNAISTQIINGYHNASAAQYAVLDKISTAIWWAWGNWDDKVISTYYEGEKPERPTPDFIEEWIGNNDFEADGYDENELKSLFE